MIDYTFWKVGDIVSADFRTADIFKKWNIDFCCNGRTVLKDACNSKKVDVQTVLEAIAHLPDSTVLPSQNFNYWEPGFLCDYIEKVHHSYFNLSKVYLIEYASKVEDNHGGNHQELVELNNCIIQLFEELDIHLKEEEESLFPIIRNLDRLYQHPDLNWSSQSGIEMIGNQLKELETEHVAAGRFFEQIRQLTKNYNPPDDACITYRVFYIKLKEFDEDLVMHIHLENNILFPKVLKLVSKFQ